MQKPNLVPKFFPLLAGGLAVGAALSACAQANLPIYTDRLVNNFQDWSWASRNLANTSPVHSGVNSISVSASVWQAISLHVSDFDTSVYDSFSFWANGGAAGGQLLQVNVEAGGGALPSYQLTPALPANAWQQYVIPLSNMSAANRSDVNRLTIQLRSGGTSGTFFLDDIQLSAKPAPALVHLNVNAGQTIRSVDYRMFAVNTAIWDSNFDRSQTRSALTEMGTKVLRFPGGSLSDEYHWRTGTSLTNTWKWVTSFSNFVSVATNVGAQAFITVNYGTGTPAEAAGWVRHANVTNHYGFRYWEIGNENYGGWETDSNTYPHDAYTYAVRARDYFQQMKAADPTIKVGMVVTPGENSYVNNYSNHPAINPRTGQTHYGWTPVLLATITSLGVRPDFLVHHVYPQYTGPESDPLVLQSARGWAIDAADLRQQITDYVGPDGTNIELVCTENNSNSGAQGRQSTSLVNGLYYADSLNQILKTEFNAFVWWDLRNGTDNNGSMDPTIYGWRTYGDLGMINGLSTKHPTFYAAKLMQYFARPGETILGASSDYLLLSVYAARQSNGALNVLVINKDTTTNFNAQLSLTGFNPYPVATFRSYGIPQDEAARTNGPAQAQNLATNTLAGVSSSFTYSFPAVSLTLFTFAPAAPSLAVIPGQPADRFVFQLQGQPGVRYVIQSAASLGSWTAVSTNTLAGPTLNFTNSLAGSALKFWRAAWQP